MKPKKYYYIKLWSGNSSLNTAETSYKKAIKLINEWKSHYTNWIITNNVTNIFEILPKYSKI